VTDMLLISPNVQRCVKIVGGSFLGSRPLLMMGRWKVIDLSAADSLEHMVSRFVGSMLNARPSDSGSGALMFAKTARRPTCVVLSNARPGARSSRFTYTSNDRL
jgi:hypothetical protein